LFLNDGSGGFSQVTDDPAVTNTNHLGVGQHSMTVAADLNGDSTGAFAYPLRMLHHSCSAAYCGSFGRFSRTCTPFLLAKARRSPSFPRTQWTCTSSTIVRRPSVEKRRPQTKTSFS
jgi:hypothetical protein